MKTPVYHKHTKHIDMRFHYICVKYRDKTVDVEDINVSDQIAEIFMKALLYNYYKIKFKLCLTHVPSTSLK